MIARSVLLIALLMLASACGGAGVGAPSPSASSAPTASAAGNVVLPKPELTSIKMGLASVASAANIGVYVKQLGLSGKYGVNIEFVQFNGTGPALQALIAGQVDMNYNTASAIFPTIGTSSHSQVVWVPRSNVKDILFSQAAIKTAADLKGKTVAISSIGGASYASAILALKELGLTDKDVTLVAVGNDQQRLAALRGGSVAASVQDNTQEKPLNDQGFVSLVRLKDLKTPVGQPGSSIIVPVDFQKKNPNTVLAVVATYMDGFQQFRALGAKGAAPYLIKEMTSLSLDEAERQIALELEEPWQPKDGMCRAEDITFAKQIALSANPALANIDPLLACNNEFLLKLKDLGFQKKLGVPGY